MMGWTVPLTASLGWVAVLGMAFVAPLDEASAQGRGGRGGSMGGGMGGARPGGAGFSGGGARPSNMGGGFSSPMSRPSPQMPMNRPSLGNSMPQSGPPLQTWVVTSAAEILEE